MYPGIKCGISGQSRLLGLGYKSTDCVRIRKRVHRHNAVRSTCEILIARRIHKSIVISNNGINFVVRGVLRNTAALFELPHNLYSQLRFERKANKKKGDERCVANDVVG